MNLLLKKKILIWLLLSINLLFVFTIGFTIPFMESESRFNLGILIIPMLILLNYIFIDRFLYITRVSMEIKETLDEGAEKKKNKKKRPVIEFKGKKYSFSTRALILYPIGTIILAICMILFFEMRVNFWLHELVAKQTVFFLNLFFKVGAETSYLPELYYPWHIDIPGGIGVYIISGCTGAPAMSILSFVVICTPHSHDPKTREDIIWRKTVDIIAMVTLIYLFNIFRMVLVFYLYHIGFAWDLVHDSLANLSAVVAAHIFIFWLCNKYIPEWYISIYYSGKLMYNKIRGKEDF